MPAMRTMRPATKTCAVASSSSSSSVAVSSLQRSSYRSGMRALVRSTKSSGGALTCVCKESRIGKQPITVPSGVTVTIDGQDVKVKGKLGELEQSFTKHVKFDREGDVIQVSRADETRLARQQHGLARSLVNNMVLGVDKGFEKKLIMIGVGYKGEVNGNKLILSLGYSHRIEMTIPEGVDVKIDKNINVTISSYDKQLLGQFAADVRSKRPPEPYKGKGVQFIDEKIIRKAGKSGKK